MLCLRGNDPQNERKKQQGSVFYTLTSFAPAI